MLGISILFLAVTATFALECTCPENYRKGENNCQLFVERMPCNTTIPICRCPKNHQVTPSHEFGYVCKKQLVQNNRTNKKIKCLNYKEFENFLTKIADNSTWYSPPESCKCEENFRVSKNWDMVLCVHPQSYWREIPCGFEAPPACKCDDEQIYGATEDMDKLGYNSFYGCHDGKIKVNSCLNEDDIKDYYNKILKFFD